MSAARRATACDRRGPLPRRRLRTSTWAWWHDGGESIRRQFRSRCCAASPRTSCRGSLARPRLSLLLFLLLVCFRFAFFFGLGGLAADDFRLSRPLFANGRRSDFKLGARLGDPDDDRVGVIENFGIGGNLEVANMQRLADFESRDR